MCPSKEIQENADQNEDIDNKQVSKMRDCEVVKIPTLPTVRSESQAHLQTNPSYNIVEGEICK